MVVALACGWLLVSDLQLASRSDWPLSALLVPLLFTIVQLGYSVLTSISFFRRKRSALPLIIGFYAFAIVAAVGQGTGRWASTLPAGSDMAPLARLSDVARIVLFSGPWLVYLARAKRVTQTFVVP